MRRLTVIGIFIVIALGLTAPANAQVPPKHQPLVILSGRIDIPKGQQVPGIVIFSGSLTVEGTVNGPITAFGAPVTISGRVYGNVIAFKGPLKLLNRAVVTGDVRSRNQPLIEPGANVKGITGQLAANFGWIWRLLSWLAVSLSLLLFGLFLLWLAGRAANSIAQIGRSAVLACFGWGILLFIGLPLLALIANLTVVGLPLGFGLLAAMGLIYATGYCASAWIIGRRIVRESTGRVASFLAGWAVLRVLAFIPIVHIFLFAVAVIYGLGALLVTLRRSRASTAAASVA
jgi:Polymer-forming cytoskeletal